MASTLWPATRLFLISCLLSSPPLAADAQPLSAQWQAPASVVGGAEKPISNPLAQPALSEGPSRPTAFDEADREQAARDVAFRYLSLWSEPKQVTLASASSLYASTVQFHGRRRTVASLVAEKRRFARRWPHRKYGHRPETTQVTCSAGNRCTVRASFDFAATNSRGDRRSRGVGEHELVVSFVDGRAMIVAEDSRVIIRGHGNMTQFLDGRP